MADVVAGPIGWERALMAAEKVKERLRRATKALDDASVAYAVVGGNAVAEWVGRIRVDDDHALPNLDDSERAAEFQVASLEALVRMKLIANRRKDQVHLLDLIGVGLLDATWPARFPPPLGARLQQLLDDPNG